MRALSISLAAALLLAGCQYATAPSDAPAARWDSAAAAPSKAGAEERMARWEREWEESKQSVAMARDDAATAGATIPPEVDRQVTELLDRQIEVDQDEEARIEDLQVAVSDALRLAELLSVR
jgi:Spy/CpxP family protein refolding chaperone